MGTAWADGGPSSDSAAAAGPSKSPQKPTGQPASQRKRTKAPKPFVSADNKPDGYDGVFRVVIITSGSVASVKLPLIVGELSKNQRIDVQVVATDNSRHFYNQEQVDEQVRLALDHPKSEEFADDTGVRIWTDSDEWRDWTKLGDPILHIELRRWADLVVVAPCSANFLAKLAAGMCDNLPLSLLRALPTTTPVILCPAMNTHMYSHPFTAQHLLSLEVKLGYLISGPQGAGKLACGDEGPGKMTDWRDIVGMIETFAQVYDIQRSGLDTPLPLVPTVLNPPQHSICESRSPRADHLMLFTQKDEQKQGYSGDLARDGEQDDLDRAPTVPTRDASDRGWTDIWPHIRPLERT